LMRSPTNGTTVKADSEYNTASVSRGNVRVYAKGTGTLVGNKEVSLSFSTSGTVSELNVKVGDKVSAGQVLARIGDLDKLQATVASDELAVLQAQQALDTLSANAQVALATAYKTWIDAKSAYADAQTAEQRTTYARCSKEVNAQNLETLNSIQERLNNLTDKDYGSQSWINAKNDYDTAYANWKYCAGYTTQELADAKATTNVDQQTVDQAEKAYNDLNANQGIDPATLKIDQATINEAQIQLVLAKKNLDGATITSPIDGTVISVAAGKGAVVDTTTFITVADLSSSYVQIQIDEADMDKMTVGNKVEVVFDAIPEKTFTGKVIQVNPALVTSGEYQVVEGLVTVDQELSNNGQPMLLGMNGSVNVISKQADNVLRVPLDALRDLGNGEYAVFLVDRDGKLRLKTVQVGLEDATYAEIKSGLQERQTVSTGAVKTAN